MHCENDEHILIASSLNEVTTINMMLTFYLNSKASFPNLSIGCLLGSLFFFEFLTSPYTCTYLRTYTQVILPFLGKQVVENRGKTVAAKETK